MIFRNRFWRAFLSAVLLLGTSLTPRILLAGPAKAQVTSLVGKWAFDHFNLGQASCRPIDAKLAGVLSAQYFCNEAWIASSNPILLTCTERDGRREFFIFSSKQYCEDELDQRLRKMYPGY